MRLGRIGEKGIETSVKRWAERNGWYVRKFVSPGHRGVPDDLFIKEGRVVFIEFKAPYGKPSKLQLLEIQRLREAGVEAHWCNNVDASVQLLEHGVTPGTSSEAKGLWLGESE